MSELRGDSMTDKYNNIIPKLLGKIMARSDLGFAITISQHCTLYSVPKPMVGQTWRDHEECHKEQFRRYGWCKFVWLYIRELIRHGYKNNRFEIEARYTG